VEDGKTQGISARRALALAALPSRVCWQCGAPACSSPPLPPARWSPRTRRSSTVPPSQSPSARLRTLAVRSLKRFALTPLIVQGGARPDLNTYCAMSESEKGTCYICSTCDEAAGARPSYARSGSATRPVRVGAGAASWSPSYPTVARASPRRRWGHARVVERGLAAHEHVQHYIEALQVDLGRGEVERAAEGAEAADGRDVEVREAKVGDLDVPAVGDQDVHDLEAWSRHGSQAPSGGKWGALTSTDDVVLMQVL
jgi:hypothetical protein